MNVLKIQYLNMDISDQDMDKIKLSIPIANELTKDYKSEVVRRQTLLGKYLVTKYLNCKEGDIYYNSLKKPYDRNNLYFNISHSKDYIVFAKSASEIGIDIEYIDKKNLNIINYAFTENEIEYINNSNENIKNINERFTVIWTIKESLFKASGLEKWMEPKNIETCKLKINDSFIIDKNIIENEIIFNEKKYLVYSTKFNNYYISVASEEKYDDICLEEVKLF